MKYYKSFLLSAIATIFSSCGSSTSTPSDSVTISDLYPLAVGNSWIFHHQGFNPDSTVAIDITTESKVLSTLVRDEKLGILIASLNEIYNDTAFQYYSGADLFQIRNKASNPNPEKIAHYPIAVGESVLLREIAPGDVNNVLRMVTLRAKDESVTVPAGTFSCYKFEFFDLVGSAKDTTNRIVTYIAPKIGGVLSKAYAKSQGIKYLSTETKLTSYSVK